MGLVQTNFSKAEPFLPRTVALSDSGPSVLVHRLSQVHHVAFFFYSFINDFLLKKSNRDNRCEKKKRRVKYSSLSAGALHSVEFSITVMSSLTTRETL